MERLKISDIVVDLRSEKIYLPLAARFNLRVHSTEFGSEHAIPAWFNIIYDSLPLEGNFMFFQIDIKSRILIWLLKFTKNSHKNQQTTKLLFKKVFFCHFKAICKKNQVGL